MENTSDPNSDLQLAGISLSDRELARLNVKRRLDFRLNPELFYTWWHTCTVKVLLVTDGGLDFGEGDFGLSTLVRALKNDAPSRVRFEITLAHIRSVGNAAMLGAEPGIARRIESFRFDDANHFTPQMYDEIWLFGIEPSYSGMAGRGEFLAPAELDRVTEHMQRGGGVFATGDHGMLGRALCGGIPRVRGMRYWGNFPNNNDATNEVSMAGPRRNDTNQIGHDAGSSFSDQSDDVPQTLDLTLYSTRVGVLRRARYPHPVLCGRLGRIDVLPDHPHEGECRVPPDLGLPLGSGDEYPLDSNGVRVQPEVIARSRVLAGNNARGSKSPTVAHSFGAISAYDGHRAGAKGRVVCDATWHHFVNVNLIGVLEGGIFDEFGVPGEDSSKHDGFLSSPAGRAALAKIKNYYTNIGVWIAPPERHTCFNRRMWWELVFADRIMEAALISPDVRLESIPVGTLMYIGTHARDVFARRASQCQTLEWILDWVVNLDLLQHVWIDPWDPVTRIHPDQFRDAPLPAFDPMPIVDVALGAALVVARQQFPHPPAQKNDKDDKLLQTAVEKGARYGAKLAKEHVLKETQSFVASLR